MWEHVDGDVDYVSVCDVGGGVRGVCVSVSCGWGCTWCMCECVSCVYVYVVYV